MTNLMQKHYEKDFMTNVLDFHYHEDVFKRYRYQTKKAQLRFEGARSQIRPAELQLRIKISMIIKSNDF